MHNNMKFDVAFEVLSQYNSMILNKYQENSQELNLIQSQLISDREELLCGNEAIINKIINQYGKEIKQNG